MKHHRPLRRLLAGSTLVLALAACGGNTPATTTAPPATGTPVAGAPLSGQNVCLAMTEPLLLAALGEGIGEPEYGEVAGGDGVYCYFPAAGDSELNVEAQVDLMTQTEFNALAQTLGATEPLAGVGSSAFSLAGAYTGVPGASVLAWDEGVGVTVLIERDNGDQAAMIEAAKAIAGAILAGL